MFLVIEGLRDGDTFLWVVKEGNSVLIQSCCFSEWVREQEKN